ncbi:MAG: hypothetical protein JNM93_07310 [Bacteriovoracaceae bacterium]|nr:hypothetical protein [Bacteriovoracaceae bacterium]
MMEIQLVDCTTLQVIETFALQDEETAYRRATHLESLGIEVKLVIPNVTDSLAHELGLNTEQKTEYTKSIHAELHDHDAAEESDSCCFKNSNE